MSDTVHATRPPNSSERELLKKFNESFAAQSELMDKLGQQLLTVELAIPGLYVTALKLLQGDEATLPLDRWLYLAFGGWTLALLLTFIGLFPRRWRVDTTKLSGQAAQRGDPLSIEGFFSRSARWKYWLFGCSIFFFWLGILGAARSLF